jgi:hypothetical protein
MVQFELFAYTDVGEVLIYAMTSYTSLQPSTTALSATVRCTVYLGESTTLVAVISRRARARPVNAPLQAGLGTLVKNTTTVRRHYWPSVGTSTGPKHHLLL